MSSPSAAAHPGRDRPDGGELHLLHALRRECPSWCIYIDSHTETAPSVREQARERSRNVLDRFAIDFTLCMYGGICIEACPFDALFWSPEFEYAETHLRNLTHEKDRLRERDVDRAGAPADRPWPGGRPTRRPPRAASAVTTVLFSIAGAMALVAAVLVVTSRRICTPRVVAVALGAVAGCFGAASGRVRRAGQILVYVGAIVVLVLFALMLTSPDEPASRTDHPPQPVRGGGRAVLAVILGTGVVRCLRQRDVKPVPAGSAESVSTWRLAAWVLPFEVLVRAPLAALIGAIALSAQRTKRSQDGRRCRCPPLLLAIACSASVCTASWRGATRSPC